jgi:hypothetical protein
MTAARLLADLRRRGAILQVVGDCLRVDAPVGVVTATDHAARSPSTRRSCWPCCAALSRESRGPNPGCWVLRRRASCAFSATSTFADLFRSVLLHGPFLQ